MLSPNDVAQLINSNVSSANASVLNPAEDGAGDSSVLVNADSILEVAKCMRDNSQTPFNSLQVISGTDFPEYLEVSYMFAHFDPANPRDCIVKVRVNDKNTPKLESITSVYKAADWQERECYDMIGVEFNNHPDHRRILCPDDWEGFPLRKDYKVAEYYHGMKIDPEDKINQAEIDLSNHNK
jgi:NADH-quinone oxidoreductase subunit C